MTTWFTADEHYNHKNILLPEYCDRPFKDVAEMNSALINNHNEVVKDDDNVYHLGDVTLGDIHIAVEYFSLLNGQHYVLPGSHDHRWWKALRQPVNVGKYDPIETLEYDVGKEYPQVVVLCHYAMRKWDRSHYGSYHLYGHSHGKLAPFPNSMDVGVDCHNFYPVSLEYILETLGENENV